MEGLFILSPKEIIVSFLYRVFLACFHYHCVPFLTGETKEFSLVKTIWFFFCGNKNNFEFGMKLGCLFVCHEPWKVWNIKFLRVWKVEDCDLCEIYSVEDLTTFEPLDLIYKVSYLLFIFYPFVFWYLL